MVEDDEVAAFIAELTRARRVAGLPSYREIQGRSAALQGCVVAADLRVEMLTASTVQRILAGGGSGLPKWRLVARLVFVLRDIANASGVDPDRVGTLTMWKAMHEAADAAMCARTRIGHGVGTPVAWSDDDQGIGDALDLLCRFAGADRDRLRALARETMRLGWWRGYHDVVPRWMWAYLSLEPAARLIRTYDGVGIPALLQTPAYAEALIRVNHPGLAIPQILRRQALWTWRQQILFRAAPVKVWAVIDEAALRARIDPEVMRGQVKRLIELCNLRNVRVQVMPSDTVGHAVAGGPITLLRFPQREFPGVVYLEQLTDALYPATRDDLHHYDMVLNRLGIEALAPQQSIEVLHQILGQM